MQLCILASSVTKVLDQPYVSLMYVLHFALRMHIRVGTPYSVWKGFSTFGLPSPLSVYPEGMVQAANKRDIFSMHLLVHTIPTRLFVSQYIVRITNIEFQPPETKNSNKPVSNHLWPVQEKYGVSTKPQCA